MKKFSAPKSFEDALARLETLTQSMQNPQLPLEDSLNAFQEGQFLVAYCQEKLADVEQKVQALTAEGTLKALGDA